MYSLEANHRLTGPARAPQPPAAVLPLGALLATLGPLLCLLGPAAGPAGLPRAARTPLLLLATAATTLGGLLLAVRPRTGRWLSVGGVFLAALMLSGVTASRPALALAFGAVLLLIGSALLWPLPGTLDRPGHDAHPPPQPDSLPAGDSSPAEQLSGDSLARNARIAVTVALSGWFLVAAARVTLSPWALGGASASIGIAGLFAIRAVRPGSRTPRSLWGALAGLGLMAAGVGLAGFPLRGLTLWALGPLGITLLGRSLWSAGPTREIPVLSAAAKQPARLLILSFVAAGMLGGGLLALAESSASAHPVNLLDALFTAFSAVCVTGLTVQDTATAYSPFGQGVILVLIQLGGLGTMTFAALVIRALGRRLSLRHEGALAEALGARAQRAPPLEVAARIFRLSIGIEAAGALLLTVAFVTHGDSIHTALWRGVFTAVSAYCNAGFSLQTESLVPYQSHPVVLHIVAILILLGGLGPMVIGALPAWRQGRPIPLGARLAAVATLPLVLVPFVLYAALEWHGSLGSLGWGDKLHNAWLQSVTLRTAGFNSVDLSHIRAATELVMIVTMFIGGSPGSTAGGIKTTTVALLWLAVTASLRGQPDAVAGGRRVPHVAIYRAAAISTVAAVALIAVSFLLILTQPLTARLAVFEATSALGTVGLTLGATARLDEVGKVIIIVTMLLGRVGPLTLFSLLASRTRAPRFERPEEDVPVG